LTLVGNRIRLLAGGFTLRIVALAISVFILSVTLDAQEFELTQAEAVRIKAFTAKNGTGPFLVFVSIPPDDDGTPDEIFAWIASNKKEIPAHAVGLELRKNRCWFFGFRTSEKARIRRALSLALTLKQTNDCLFA
jgi:hypothetical protein